ncbi:hypothetical protein IFM89_035423 [Coptis chinensis]|uniref:RING-type domain-containing protein n=1 Tax=Coptis chinensis TaxID=261450 RepID=A0A835HGT3_9MAGN|nr:hypothetical protein IFM89_035423 [Coptis chinensis]
MGRLQIDQEENEEEMRAQSFNYHIPCDLLHEIFSRLPIRASLYPREYDGGCIQMRLSYSPVAHVFLFLVQWTDCNLAGALGLLRILIYKAYVDGKTTMSIHERKASIREFYAVIFPSLLQLERGITDVEDRKQKEVCATKYKKKDELEKGKLSELDMEREEECGICMEMNSKVVLPNCSHALCLKCYRDWENFETTLQAISKLVQTCASSQPYSHLHYYAWRARSLSCPFCRDSLKRVNSGDLWIYTDNKEAVDASFICRENWKRLLIYIDKLPLLLPDSVFASYDTHIR